MGVYKQSTSAERKDVQRFLNDDDAEAPSFVSMHALPTLIWGRSVIF